jgi:uncharacterized membrane protein YcaP (DUF421 family)
MDWDTYFSIAVNPLELVIRGTLVYWFLFLVFRFVLRRDAGAIGIADLLLLVLVADASQNAMAGGYTTVAEGAILVATIIGWNWLIDWASFHSPLIARFTTPPAIVLVRHGRIVHRNLRREHLSEDELKGKLRQHGIEQLQEVKVALMESDGEISVIRYEKAAGDDGPARKHPT